MFELQVLQNKATRHILDYPKHLSATESIETWMGAFSVP